VTNENLEILEPENLGQTVLTLQEALGLLETNEEG
jgi:hypothetical protein